jgi:hypothetical protein
MHVKKKSLLFNLFFDFSYALILISSIYIGRQLMLICVERLKMIWHDLTWQESYRMRMFAISLAMLLSLYKHQYYYIWLGTV